MNYRALLQSIILIGGVCVLTSCGEQALSSSPSSAPIPTSATVSAASAPEEVLSSRAGAPMDGAEFSDLFYNPIKDDFMLGDPWMVQQDGVYYYTQSGGNHIVIRKSDTITGVSAGESKEIWNIKSRPELSEVWAPEIHFYEGSWYCYFTARTDMKAELRRIFVLKSQTSDPMGEWDFVGKMELPEDQWAIDATFMAHEQKLYLLWSGWKDVTEGPGVWRQNIYICELSDPITVKPGTARIKLSGPDYPWETVQCPQNEGPQILKAPDGGVFCIYSASFSKSDSYCLGQLRLIGDPMKAEDWVKSETPVFQSDPGARVYSPGHCSFVKSEDGTEDWIIYHAAKDSRSGWDRSARAQKFTFDEAGFPVFGVPLTTNAPMKLPAGEKVSRRRYEAEDAGYEQVKLYDQEPASGGKLVELVNNDSAITFRITVSQAGKYPLYVRYTNHMPMRANGFITVNDEPFKEVTFQRCAIGRAAESDLGTASIPLALQAGENTIVFSGARGVRIDCVVLENIKKEVKLDG